MELGIVKVYLCFQTNKEKKKKKKDLKRKKYIYVKRERRQRKRERKDKEKMEFPTYFIEMDWIPYMCYVLEPCVNEMSEWLNEMSEWIDIYGGITHE